MLTQTEAHIYLASQRSCAQEDWYRSYNTFNAEDYQHGTRKTFRCLQSVNDITLIAGKTLAYPLKKDTGVLLLPVVGALDFESCMNIQGTLDVGQAQIFFLPKNSTLQVANPYEKELINFLLLRFDPGPEPIFYGRVDDYSFDLALTKNGLSPLHSKDEVDMQVIQTLIENLMDEENGPTG